MMTIAIAANSTQKRQVVGKRRLTTHCIFVRGEHDENRAPACLATQTVSIDAVTVVASCHVTAISAALSTVTSDLIFFLRETDCWSNEFVASLLSVYQERPEADVVYCHSIAKYEKRSQNSAKTDAIDLGFSAAATYAGLDYVARPLSWLSMRRRVIERILPLVNDPDWSNEPEACLWIAASLASARTFHLPLPLVNVDTAAQQPDPSDFSNRLKIMRLVGKIANQLGLNPDFVKQFLVMEYTSQPKEPEIITKYCRLLQAYHPDTRSRRQILLSMYRKMKDHLSSDGSLRSYVNRWWLKQRLRWTGKLAI
jgi:hypothetical protein